MLLNTKTLNKENIDSILDAFANEYSNHSSKPLDIYIVGGCAIVLNFKYRLSTIDIDAYYENSIAIEESIETISTNLNLPKDWINQDFINTPSFTDRITQVSKLYKVFGNISVYTIKEEYLIAMKLKSARPTGGDLDDILKMVYELRYNGVDITYEQIINAFDYLYDSNYSNTYEYFFDRMRKAFELEMEEVEVQLGKYRY